MSKSFDYAKEITIAAISNKTQSITDDYSKSVSNFFETVYLKLKEIEDKEYEESIK